MRGKAGTREDRSVDFKIDFDRMPVTEWMPNEWSRHVKGAVTSSIHWQGENPKLETSHGDATLRVDEGRISALPFLDKIAAITGEKELEHLKLNVCKLEVVWYYPKAEVTNVELEDNGKFRAQGAVTIEKNVLSGAIELGVAAHLLDWLPNAPSVFPRQHDGYMWTTVHLSGTLDGPQQDLSPRILEAIKESPGAALGILFRQLGEWLRHAFGAK